MTPTGLAIAHRQHQLTVRAMLLRRLLPLWKILDVERLDQTLPTWLAASGAAVQDSRKASAAVAATYLRQVRRELGHAPGTVELAATAPAEQLLTSLTVTSIAAIRTAIGAGQRPEQAMRTGFVTSSGAASRIAMQAGRETVIATVRADPNAVGWSRIASPGCCDFCLMLTDRGAVYSAETADFGAHDHCACTAAPAYGSPRVVHVRSHTPTVRAISDTDRARLRAYLHEHYSHAA